MTIQYRIISRLASKYYLNSFDIFWCLTTFRRTIMADVSAIRNTHPHICLLYIYLSLYVSNLLILIVFHTPMHVCVDRCLTVRLKRMHISMNEDLISREYILRYNKVFHFLLPQLIQLTKINTLEAN